MMSRSTTLSRVMRAGASGGCCGGAGERSGTGECSGKGERSGTGECSATGERSTTGDRSATRFAGAAVLLVIGCLAFAPAQAADIAAGEKIANERCAACHGKDGNTPIDPSYPKLGGQHADYLAIAMKAYRSERRKNAIMGAQAKPLSTADIENLAAYYAQLPSQLSLRR